MPPEAAVPPVPSRSASLWAQASSGSPMLASGFGSGSGPRSSSDSPVLALGFGSGSPVLASGFCSGSG